MPPEETQIERRSGRRRRVSTCGPSTCVASVSSWPSRGLAALRGITPALWIDRVQRPSHASANARTSASRLTSSV